MESSALHQNGTNRLAQFSAAAGGRIVSKKIVKGPFLSNCLLEAAKAKIRHPVKTKITAVLHSEAGCPHFLWSDGQNDFDFGVDRRLVGPQVLLFRGYIRQHELGFNQEYKERMRQARSCPPEGEV